MTQMLSMNDELALLTPMVDKMLQIVIKILKNKKHGSVYLVIF